MSLPLVRAVRDAARLPLYEELIVTGAWWDFVDEIAVHRLGPILRRPRGGHADAAGVGGRRRALETACGDPVPGALTAAHRHHTAGRVPRREPGGIFFLRKAVGWALRQYSRTDPGWVRGFVADHPDLAPLSRREALRHLG